MLLVLPNAKDPQTIIMIFFIITPANILQRIVTADLVGDLFVSKDAKILFHCPENETVYECL